MFRYYFLFCDCSRLTDNYLQKSTLAPGGPTNPYIFPCLCDGVSHDDRIILRDKFKILFDGYRKMIDQSFSKSKELGDMLKFLPGVVVQKDLSMFGMADLYRIKPDFLEHLIKSIEPLSPDLFYGYTLDDYLSGFLQDRNRSQIHYCDPVLQHISICRRILSLSCQSNVFDLQS